MPAAIAAASTSDEESSGTGRRRTTAAKPVASFPPAGADGRYGMIAPLMGVTLGFDTATDDTAVAVVDAGEVLAEVREGPEESGRPRHASTLLPAVEEAVGAAGGWLRVERIACGTGPGSFTGLRFGLATARALAASSGAEVVGVCTLDALAAGAWLALQGAGPSSEARVEHPPPGSALPDPELCAAVDARRGQVFAAAYAADLVPGGDGGDRVPAREGSGTAAPDAPAISMRRVAGPVACAPAELPAALGLPARLAAVGSGALRFRGELEREGLAVPGPSNPVHRVSARWTATLGAGIEQPEQHPAEPIYLRVPDAQRWRERDSKDS